MCPTVIAGAVTRWQRRREIDEASGGSRPGGRAATNWWNHEASTRCKSRCVTRCDDATGGRRLLAAKQWVAGRASRPIPDSLRDTADMANDESSNWRPGGPRHDSTDERSERILEQLLTVEEVSTLLKVPKSWIYNRTRKRGMDRLPYFKLGKYLRFDERSIERFVEHQRRKSP